MDVKFYRRRRLSGVAALTTTPLRRRRVAKQSPVDISHQFTVAFTQESFPHLQEEMVSAKGQGGIGGLIRKLTKGTISDLMLLIREASKNAIMNDLPCLNAQVLDKTWKSIQTRPTVCSLSVLTQEE